MDRLVRLLQASGPIPQPTGAQAKLAMPELLGMMFEEFHCRKGGKRTAYAATVTHDGDVNARRKWLELLHNELSDAPLRQGKEDWRNLASVLRLLEASWPGCTDHEPGSVPFDAGCRGSNLLSEAKRFASFEATLLSRRRSRHGN